MRRCLATFNKHFPSIKILCCPPTGEIKDLMDRSENEYCQVVLSEVIKLREYAFKGDIINQDIPEGIIKIVNANI